MTGKLAERERHTETSKVIKVFIERQKANKQIKQKYVDGSDPNMNGRKNKLLTQEMKKKKYLELGVLKNNFRFVCFVPLSKSLFFCV